jgi:hypothetical protein
MFLVLCPIMSRFLIVVFVLSKSKVFGLVTAAECVRLFPIGQYLGRWTDCVKNLRVKRCSI